MSKKKTYITTAIDYTNDVIHIGQAYEKILADCYARYGRLVKGEKNIGFTTGTDEHGATNEKAAKERNLPPLKHVTEISKKDKEQIDSLNISYDRWIRTTDEDHKKVAAEFFEKAYDNGDIYKGTYTGLYCEGCEAHKTLTELNENDQCPLHTTREIQTYEEKNYFFKWSKYSVFLKELVSSDDFVLPERRRNEMLSFIDQGIQDIPVTRPKFKLPWGITCPIDEDQVIYVWFDALINYYTFGSQNGFWDENTKIVHFVGKDVARWHTLLWPAMLKSAGYRLPDTVYVHGFINLNEEKISKSKGNVIIPTELVKKYGTDAVRYYFLRYGPIVEDVSASKVHIENVYNGELAHGLGNTVSRVAKLAEQSKLDFGTKELEKTDSHPALQPLLNEFRPDKAIRNIWKIIGDLDKHINENLPWEITDKTKLKKILDYEVNQIKLVAKLIGPFLPETAEKIQKQFSGETIKAAEGIFPSLKS